MPDPGRDAKPWAKKKPTIALFPLDRDSTGVLQECFSQFNIDVSPATELSIFKKEKLEGCVVSLTSPTVEKIVSEARNSPWQKQMVIYGVGPVAAIRGLAKYGINVLLDSPVARPQAVKAIHATRRLLLNELRRYVRLPLATPVAVEYEGRRMNATSVEVSAGGMSLECKDPCPPAQVTAYASFAVPGSSQVTIAGNVCWSDHDARQFGLRFEPGAEGRQAVRTWIEDYLEFK